jgi:acylpyruvate hydrolase
MQLVKFDDGRGARLGCLLGGWEGTQLIDVASALPGLPCDVGGLFAAGRPTLDLVAGLLRDPAPELLVSRTRVRLRAPLARPRRILCVGYNYRGHTGDVPDPEFPDVFAKVGNVVVGPGDAILVPSTTDQVDYEAELAVVIGTAGRCLSIAQAKEHIGGYTIFNDVSARDWQHHASQWTLGKSFDTFGPMGPLVATPDELADSDSLDVTATLNGETTIASSTRQMVADPCRLLSYISQAITLEPGDVIATGTPQKLPAALAEPRWLQPGDCVSITITGLGTLTNPVAAWPNEQR